jgi:glycerol-3-phosphate dehydrogenase
MRRTFSALTAGPFDLLVVGGGITGACIARDAALRGIKTAIIERNDWSSGTSSASSKLVHGGLRYLKTMEFGLIRESLAERRIWERIAPHLVHPLPFMVPFFAESFGARMTLRAGLTLYDLLAFDKGWLDDPDQRLPGHRMMSRAEAIAAEPVLDQPGFTGALRYYDCQMDAPERLGLECVIDAVENGAAAVNYVEAVEFLRGADGIAGVRVRDRFSGAETEVRAKATLNCAGPWADFLLAKADGGDSSVHLLRSKGIHVIVPSVTRTHALTVQYKGKHFFVLPWRGHTILGTTDTPFDDHPDEVRPTEADIAEMLAAVNGGLPFLRVKPEDVLHAYAGLRPLVADGSSSSYNASRKSEIVDHARSGAPGLFSAIGGKWTTSRHVAQKAVDLVQARLGQKRVDPQTGVRPLPGGATGRIAAFKSALKSKLNTLPPPAQDTLGRLYGARYDRVTSLSMEDGALLAPLSNSVADTGAAVIHAVRQEMAMTLSDIVFRRTGLGGLGHPGRTALDRAAQIMAKELAWSAEETARQIAAAEAQFPMGAA